MTLRAFFPTAGYEGGRHSLEPIEIVSIEDDYPQTKWEKEHGYAGSCTVNVKKVETGNMMKYCLNSEDVVKDTPNNRRLIEEIRGTRKLMASIQRGLVTLNSQLETFSREEIIEGLKK